MTLLTHHRIIPVIGHNTACFTQFICIYSKHSQQPMGEGRQAIRNGEKRRRDFLHYKRIPLRHGPSQDTHLTAVLMHTVPEVSPGMHTGLCCSPWVAHFAVLPGISLTQVGQLRIRLYGFKLARRHLWPISHPQAPKSQICHKTKTSWQPKTKNEANTLFTPWISATCIVSKILIIFQIRNSTMTCFSNT